MSPSCFVSADKLVEEKRRLSPSWITLDPKQTKLTRGDKTGYFILCLQYIHATNLGKEYIGLYFNLTFLILEVLCLFGNEEKESRLIN